MRNMSRRYAESLSQGIYFPSFRQVMKDPYAAIRAKLQSQSVGEESSISELNLSNSALHTCSQPVNPDVAPLNRFNSTIQVRHLSPASTSPPFY